MLLFAECCVVIPCNTIEDFPSRLNSDDARSLLGALTASWHPGLITATGRTPTWYRADEMPPPVRVPSPDDGGDRFARYRLILVPEASFAILPKELSEAISDRSFALIESTSPEFVGDMVVRVTSRQNAIEQITLAIEQLDNGCNESIDWLVHCEGCDATEGRQIDQNDFYALGYTWWQVQVLTRKLRYTSNLDQLHFENRLTEAAARMLAKDAGPACEALYDCFDALAEERDHYFSSDPSIIDLTLLTPGTIALWLDSLPNQSATENQSEAASSLSSQLATPQNVLVDEDVALAVVGDDTEQSKRFRETLASGRVGWCGGGPSADFRLEMNSIDEVEHRVARAMAVASQLTGKSPAVYARLGGGVASQWLPAIVAAGFHGVVPIDFLNGRGFDNESKVILGEGASEIEALTAKPLDANDDASFLTLAARLGEAIDGGEIATALLAHWPGSGCDSFRDVRRAATWTLALGKFWKIDDYFIDGERPYHHGQNPTATSSAEASVDATETVAQTLHLERQLRRQTCLNLQGMLALIQPEGALHPEGVSEPNRLIPSDAIDSDAIGFSDGRRAAALRQRIVEAMGHSLVTGTNSFQSVALINAHQPATREMIRLDGKIARMAPSVFFSVAESSRSRGDVSRAVVDVPAWGFCIVGQANSVATTQRNPESPNLIQKLGRWLRRPASKILDGTRMSNEFMEVAISAEHGGVSGVYSGRGRGNRFSTRLVMTPQGSSQMVASVCDSVTTIEDNRVCAIIELKGHFVTENERLPWTARYRLDRGSRRLCFQIRVRSPKEPLASEQTQLPMAWKHLPCLRVAIAEATPIVRSLVSERLQRTSAKTFSSSMGFLVEETDERKTLVATKGATEHRRVEDRFIDTLLVPTEAETWQSFEFGFDLPNPMSSAKSFVEQGHGNRNWHGVVDGVVDGVGDTDSPIAVPLSTPTATAPFAQQGWLLHVSPSTLDVQVVGVGRVRDQQDHLAIHFRVIQTAARATKATLRFCRTVHAVIEVSSANRPLDRSPTGNADMASTANVLQLSDLESQAVSQSATAQSDRVVWSQSAHGVVHLVVLFETGMTE